MRPGGLDRSGGLLRILLIGYLYGITSERKLVEELRNASRLALVYRAGLRSGSPHHSTFSKNRHGRFQQSRTFEELFERDRGSVRCKQVRQRASICRWMAASYKPMPPMTADTTRAVDGSGTGEPHRTAVLDRTGRAERGWGSRCISRTGYPPRMRMRPYASKGKAIADARLLRQLPYG